jgi:6-pyruvoyl-tetrahydropterin synthase
MAKDPAVLLYTQDFLVGTLSMTDEQRGKYIYLLCLQHQKGRLTLKDLKSKLSDEDIEIAERFPLQADGFYYNQRMYDEALKRKNYTESRRTNRTTKKTSDIDVKKLSESYVKSYDKSYDKSYVNRMENENENENEDVNKTVIKAANKTVSKAANKTVSNSTRKIIKKALDILIEHNLSKEQYAEAAFNVNDIGGLEKTYQLLGIRTGDDWTRVILQNSQMYGFNIKEK